MLNVPDVCVIYLFHIENRIVATCAIESKLQRIPLQSLILFKLRGFPMV